MRKKKSYDCVTAHRQTDHRCASSCHQKDLPALLASFIGRKRKLSVPTAWFDADRRAHSICHLVDTGLIPSPSLLERHVSLPTRALMLSNMVRSITRHQHQTATGPQLLVPSSADFGYRDLPFSGSEFYTPNK